MLVKVGPEVFPWQNAIIRTFEVLTVASLNELLINQSTIILDQVC